VIPMNDLQVIDKVGEGGFATVYKALWTKTGSNEQRLVAVKQLKNKGEEKKETEGDESNEFAEFRKEVIIMSGLSHPNIVRLHGICLEPLAMVMDFISQGSLEAFLADRSIEITWPMRIKIAMDIARGMRFLHSQVPPIIHRDLKSANILIDRSTGEIVCRIADFGSCVAEARIKRRVVDNPVWCAPEVLRGQEYTEKVDVYSYGIILYELLTRSAKLFPGIQWWYIIEDMIKAGKRPELPSDCPTPYRTLIQETWDDTPHKRPSFDDIVTALLSFSLVITKHETN
jgi:serine/threonine protein kinase